MTSFAFAEKFADEFDRLPSELQDRIDDFLDIYEAHGLDDFTRYPGKITPSWKGVLPGHPNFVFAFANGLWPFTPST